MSVDAVGAGFVVGGRTLWSDLRWSARAGEFTALVGPNGAGKSTLLRVLAGLLAPTTGRVEIDGRDAATMTPAERARKIAYVPQEGRPLFPVTALDYATYGAEAAGDPAPEARRRAAAELDRAGLSALAERPVARLSGGEFRRLASAQARLQRARYLLLDEPVRDLDPRRQWEICDELRQDVASGVGVVAVLHDLGLASRFADRVAVLAGGRLLADAPPAAALTDAVLAEAYGVTVVRFPAGESGRYWIQPSRPLRPGESTETAP